MNKAATFWVTLRNRPLFMLGIVAGLAACAFLFLNTVSINKRITHVESHSPCTNLTAHECALKLFSLLTPSEKQGVRERVRTLRQQEQQLLRQRNRLRQQIQRTPLVPGRPAPVGRLPKRHGGPTATTQPPSSGGGQSPTTSEPTPTPPPKPTPLVHVPPVTTPQVGPVPPQRTPTIEVPCIPVMPIIKCDS